MNEDLDNKDVSIYETRFHSASASTSIESGDRSDKQIPWKKLISTFGKTKERFLSNETVLTTDEILMFDCL